MRNLKKILALVLALVMSMSLVTVSSAAFKDEEVITAKYNEAIQVLSGLEVFQGRPDGNFDPQNTITRAEVAAIIYRVVTGDVEDKQVGIYADYNKFDDVKSTAWYAGYVNYCANAEYIRGYDAKTFGPNDKVTGYQALAMILRAVGYDKAGEFSGDGWEVQTAKYGKQLGITNTLTDSTLGSYATREVVAEILFRAIQVPQVTYTLALGYNQYDAIVNGDKNPSLGYETFLLAYDETVYHNGFGQPYNVWFYDDYDEDLTWDSAFEAVVYQKYYTPVYSFNTAMSECDVSKAIGNNTTKTPTRLTVNGVASLLTDYMLATSDSFDGVINATGTKSYMGAQGRLTEIYYTEEYAWEVVMIDEFLAYVEDVTEVEYDKNGHREVRAQLVLTVYDGSGLKNNLVLESNSNWEYAVGDFLIINAMTDDNTLNGTVIDQTYNYEVYYVEGLAETLIGGQTAYTTKASHWVEGVEYPDALRFVRDDAGMSMADHTWFFDSYGNVIGNAVIDTVYSFGTITAIKWVDSNTDLSNGYALATITYVDGTQATEKVYMIDKVVLSGVEGKAADYASGLVSSTKQYNESTVAIDCDFTNVAMYSMVQDAYNRGLILTSTTELVDAEIETGVPTIAANMKAGNATMFLYYDATNLVYKTYTGIKNVPSFEPYGVYYGYDKNKDGVAEYVFVADSSETSAYATYTYFVEADKFHYTTHLHPIYGELYYTLHNGFVNGVEQELDVWDIDDVNTLKANRGKLVLVSMTDDYVTGVTKITDKPVWVKSLLSYVVYAGAGFVDGADAGTANDNSYSYVNGQEVLTIDGETYDVEGVQVVTDDDGIRKSINKANAYFYIVYSEGTNFEKAAKTVYISTVKGDNYQNGISDYLSALEAAIEELKAALAAAGNVEGYGKTAAGDSEYSIVVAAIDAAMQKIAAAKIALDKIYNDPANAALKTDAVQNAYAEVDSKLGAYVTFTTKIDEQTGETVLNQYTPATNVTNIINEVVKAGVKALVEDLAAAKTDAVEERIKAQIVALNDAVVAVNEKSVNDLAAITDTDFNKVVTDAAAAKLEAAKKNALAELDAAVSAELDKIFACEDNAQYLVYVVTDDATIDTIFETVFDEDDAKTFETEVKALTTVKDIADKIAKKATDLATAIWGGLLVESLVTEKKVACEELDALYNDLAVILSTSEAAAVKAVIDAGKNAIMADTKAADITAEVTATTTAAYKKMATIGANRMGKVVTVTVTSAAQTITNADVETEAYKAVDKVNFDVKAVLENQGTAKVTVSYNGVAADAVTVTVKKIVTVK